MELRNIEMHSILNMNWSGYDICIYTTCISKTLCVHLSQLTEICEYIRVGQDYRLTLPKRSPQIFTFLVKCEVSILIHYLLSIFEL